jgi:hypothetical protein
MDRPDPDAVVACLLAALVALTVLWLYTRP